MKTTAISLEIKSDLSEISEAMEKLRAIADILPVTVANFIAGAGGITGLVEQRIAPPTEGVAWFLARPTVKLQRFLEMFDADDLALQVDERRPLAPDETRHTVADCVSRFMGFPLNFGGFPGADAEAILPLARNEDVIQMAADWAKEAQSARAIGMPIPSSAELALVLTKLATNQ